MNWYAKMTALLIAVSLVHTNVVAVSLKELIHNDSKAVALKKGLLPGVVILDLNNRNIDSLEGLKEIPGIETVTRLHLHGNNIQSIDKGIFAATPKLRLLDLSNNKVMAIQSGTFEGLNSLTVLNLSNNAIRKIEENGFKGMPNLRFLGLAGYPLTARKKSAFQAQVPQAFITTQPVTPSNIKKWAGFLAASIIALLTAIALIIFHKSPTKESQFTFALGEDGEPTINGVDLYGAAPYSVGVVSALLDGDPKNGIPPANIDKKYTEQRRTALMHAAQVGNEYVVEELIKKGANATLTDRYGNTALDLTPAGFTKTRELLIQAEQTQHKFKTIRGKRL